MKRLVIFTLLGPFLAWLTVFGLLLPELIRRPDMGALTFLLMAILIVLAVGALPSLALAAVDHLMEEWGWSRAERVVACAALGYPAAVLACVAALERVGLLETLHRHSAECRSLCRRSCRNVLMASRKGAARSRVRDLRRSPLPSAPVRA